MQASAAVDPVALMAEEAKVKMEREVALQKAAHEEPTTKSKKQSWRFAQMILGVFSKPPTINEDDDDSEFSG